MRLQSTIVEIIYVLLTYNAFYRDERKSTIVEIIYVLLTIIPLSNLSLHLQ